MPTIKYKISYGVALCRFNTDKNNQFEILYVKKRYTYHFFNFVFGNYRKYNNNQLLYLFNNMSFGEKIDILSMRFSNMWYRLWLIDPDKKYSIYKTFYTPRNIENDNKNNDNKNDSGDNFHMSNMKNYLKKKNKFESIFLRDGGSRLKRIINNSTNATAPWEIPKGRKKDNENDLECAKREFEEEASITKDKYTILNQIKPIRYSFKDEDTVYTNVYYCATLHDNTWCPKIQFDTYHQMSEVEEIRWIANDELKFLHLNYKIYTSLLKTFNTIKSNVKKHYKNI
jgi:ADP-ribose pyrophosphatase YjhB (NUDIX family)